MAALGPVLNVNVISDESVRLAQVFYGVTIPLVALATATFAFRILKSTRSRSVWSDTCIALGYALTIADWGLMMPQMFLSPGTQSPSAVIEGARGAFLAIPVWGLSMALIKASIGLTLLHIQESFCFQAFVWANIAMAGGYGFGNVWFSLFYCQPLEAAWGDFSDPNAACLSPSALKSAALAGAIVSISTDIMLSIAPITFLWSLKRPFRERVVIGFLMSLGLLAGVSSLVKILLIQKFGTSRDDDGPALNVAISTWTVLEQLLGVIAACTPFCKPLFEQFLRTLGVSLTRTDRRPGAGPNNSTPARANYQRATENDTFRSQITATRSKFEPEEDPLHIEMEAGLAEGSRDANGRIYMRKEVHVMTEELREDNRADGWKKYSPP
ncbi:hypothetical protein PG994_000751 [Apiospora phragmitis]|uniref:Rhodopsin domain-containing protein n=1 Tax=Apiospora phragmitis TaxID=2905665 RepID=A0ABR1X781_9PEZI